MSCSKYLTAFEHRGKDLESTEEVENPHLVGNCSDKEEIRNKWIDSVEKMLEHEAFERGEINSRNRFNEVMVDGDYGLGEPEKWMLAPELN